MGVCKSRGDAELRRCGVGELTVALGVAADAGVAPGDGEFFGARVFEDGTAVFDPVTWQTHIVSHDGMSLLVEMVLAARACGGDPEQVCANLLGEMADEDADRGAAPVPGLYLRQWAALACHLAAEAATAPAK